MFRQWIVMDTLRAYRVNAGVNGDEHGNVGKRRLVFFKFCIENLTLN